MRKSRSNDPNQLSLLDIPDHGAHRRTDPDTSVEAAMAVDATRLEALVAEAIRAEGTKGATTRELSEILHMDWGSITPRCAPLVRKRLIYDSGERRQWRYGRKGIVWKACNISVDSNI